MITIKTNEDRSVVITIDENITATLKANNCKFKLHNKTVTAEQILQIIQEAIRQYELSNTDDNLKLNFELTRRMHQIIGHGTHIQRVKYMQLVGCRDEIWRQELFKDAVSSYDFNVMLAKLGIINHFASAAKSKRIIAVHPLYVEHDEEIREGLKVMHHKHPQDNPVFVASEASLIYAMEDCLPGSTLVIDGHWVHQKQSRHGVWEQCSAEELAQKIADVVNAANKAVPGKIIHINLLGCESGAINPAVDTVTSRNTLFFKYDQKPALVDRDIWQQRNRAIYVSATTEDSVFSPDSLAFQVLSKLSDPSIAVTATPKLLYPWPPADPVFNIGSDSENWKDESQAWAHKAGESELQSLLGEIKSVTQVNSTVADSHAKRPWKHRPH